MLKKSPKIPARKGFDWTARSRDGSKIDPKGSIFDCFWVVFLTIFDDFWRFLGRFLRFLKILKKRSFFGFSILKKVIFCIKNAFLVDFWRFLTFFDFSILSFFDVFLQKTLFLTFFCTFFEFLKICFSFFWKKRCFWAFFWGRFFDVLNQFAKNAVGPEGTFTPRWHRFALIPLLGEGIG